MKKKRQLSTRQRIQRRSDGAQGRDVPPAIKEELVKEAGGKCANPGCSNWRTHIHHIKRWSVFKAHDAKHMIAICPSCHDAVHLKKLKITDATVYLWKGIERATPPKGHLYVEPGNKIRLHLGTIGVESTSNEATVIELSPINRLSFRPVAPDLLSLLVTSQISTSDGVDVLRVVDNHTELYDSGLVDLQNAAGHITASTSNSKRFVPDWFIPQMRQQEPNFCSDGRITLIDLEVVAPGVVRIMGTWTNAEGVICITRNQLSFCKPSLLRPLSLVGDGADATILRYKGSLTSAALFGFRGQNNSTLKV